VAREPLNRLRELAAINRALASATDYKALLGLVVDRTADFFEAKATALVLSDDVGNATIAAWRDFDPKLAYAFRAPFDERIGQRVCDLIDCKAEQFLASPVIEGGRVRGMLVVFRREALEGEEEAEVLAALADQVAIALGNALHLRRLEEATAALREAERRKDEFLSMLSHELRNPLAPIRASIFLLGRSEPDSETAAYARQVIERQTGHMARLIDDLLDMTRIARGKVTVERKPANLTEVARRTADDHRSMLNGRSLAFETDIPNEDLWMQGDSTRIAQVIANLLDNAAKFTPEGGRVALSLRADEAWAEIRVRDSGAGIEPAVRPHIFEPFVQSQQTLARSGGGLGLGLAIVKAVVELHGGTVDAQSDGAGGGSEFIVRFPRIAGPEVAVAPAAGARPSVHAKRVLVVDDNRDAAESLARMVTLFGHTTFVAHDGAGALDLAAHSRPHAVLCDIGLPGMSGYEVARRLRRDAGPASRLIAVTGYAQPDDVKKAVEAGFDAHVAKPPDPAEINRLLAFSLQE